MAEAPEPGRRDKERQGSWQVGKKGVGRKVSVDRYGSSKCEYVSEEQDLGRKDKDTMVCREGGG